MSFIVTGGKDTLLKSFSIHHIAHCSIDDRAYSMAQIEMFTFQSLSLKLLKSIPRDSRELVARKFKENPLKQTFSCCFHVVVQKRCCLKKMLSRSFK